MAEKTESVQMYVDAETKRAVRIAAAESEMTMAEYCREAVTETLRKEGHIE